MFKQNEKSIAQIAEYIPRACRGMQLQEAKACVPGYAVAGSQSAPGEKNCALYR